MKSFLVHKLLCLYCKNRLECFWREKSWLTPHINRKMLIFESLIFFLFRKIHFWITCLVMIQKYVESFKSKKETSFDWLICWKACQPARRWLSTFRLAHMVTLKLLPIRWKWLPPSFWERRSNNAYKTSLKRRKLRSC